MHMVYFAMNIALARVYDMHDINSTLANLCMLPTYNHSVMHNVKIAPGKMAYFVVCRLYIMHNRLVFIVLYGLVQSIHVHIVQRKVSHIHIMRWGLYI